jgi:hypothetical protein
MSTFRKEVAGPDKFFIAFNEIRPPFVIQLTLEGVGDPSGDSLYDALEETTEANPGSSLRLDETSEPLSWTIGPPPQLTIVDAPEFTGRREIEAPFLLWPLEAHKGPTCELLLVHGKEKNYLVFRAIHAVMDGQGTLLWAKDFMRCLRGEAPEGHASTLTIDQLIREMNPPRRELPEPDALHPFGLARATTEGRFHWRRIVVPRPLDAGVSGRILVALGERARRDGAVGAVRIALPTDLRRYCPNEQSTGNLFGGLSVDVPPGASAETIGLRVVQMLYRDEGTKPFGLYSGDRPGSLAAHRVKVFYDISHLHDLGRYSFSATLSHLGVLKREELSAPTFTTTGAFFVPLVGDAGCVVSLNGLDDHTEACAGLSDRFTHDDHLDELEAILVDAITGPT